MATKQAERLICDSVQFSKLCEQAEQITGPFAELLLRQANFPSQAEQVEKLVVLDEACGTGIVSGKIMKLLSDDAKSKMDLTCADLADAVVDGMKKRIETSGWTQAKAIKADAQVSPLKT